MSKIIETYHQMAKKIIMAPKKVRKKADKGHSRVLSQRSLSWIKHETVNNSSLISGELFHRSEEITVTRRTPSRLPKQRSEY